MSEFHPAYGLTDELREEVVSYAEQNGVRKAAEEFCLAQSTIYVWRRRMGADRYERVGNAENLVNS